MLRGMDIDPFTSLTPVDWQPAIPRDEPIDHDIDGGWPQYAALDDRDYSGRELRS